MENEYNSKLCDERHEFIVERLKSIELKMNAFYVLVIATLAGVIATFFKT